MQTRIEQFLERSGIMLVIDEAHRLFSPSERVRSHPEMLNWVYTLWDKRIPCGLLVTPQFLKSLEQTEKDTYWRSGQLKRRITCWTKLPAKLNESDVRAVAKRLAPRYTESMIAELVDFAIPSRRQLDALRRAIVSAEFIAEEQGRSHPTRLDLDEGIKEAQATELSMTTQSDRDRLEKSEGRRSVKAGRPSGCVPSLPTHCSPDAEPVQGDGRNTLAGLQSPSRGMTPPMVLNLAD
jgi:hypothetical protein